ncbi:MAG: CPBP family intramembrane glutamic endopeptidase [Saonia sp.]
MAILLAIKFWNVKWDSHLKLPSLKLIAIVMLITFFVKMVSFLANPYYFTSDILDGKLYLLSYKTFSFENPIVIISLLFFEPIIEEFIFRKIIFLKIKKYFGLIAGMIVSSLLFSFAHLGVFDNFKMFIYGIFYCFIFYRTKNIVLSIIAHSLFNLIALNTMVFHVDLIDNNYPYLLVYLLGLIGIYLCVKKLNELKIQKPQ